MFYAQSGQSFDGYYRCTFYLCNIHQRIVLIGRRTYLQFTILNDQPSPARAETRHPCIRNFSLKLIEIGEGRIDSLRQCTGRFSTTIRTHDSPEHRSEERSPSNSPTY